jgi:catechol 2,3-dioxygenase-like lactoylglutathione lyase family enzyme
MEAQMNSVEVSSETATGSPPVKAGEMRLGVVVVPVSDVDRAKRFYESLGWRLDADLPVDDGYRVVRLTPPGSGCSIVFIRGIDVSEPFHDVTGIFHHAGSEGRVSGPAPGHADYGSFAAFSDPDGKHEERTGEEDPNWPDWYALYMVRERAGEELPT